MLSYSENKGADLQLCFRTCKKQVSHDVAHLKKGRNIYHTDLKFSDRGMGK